MMSSGQYLLRDSLIAKRICLRFTSFGYLPSFSGALTQVTFIFNCYFFSFCVCVEILEDKMCYNRTKYYQSENTWVQYSLSLPQPILETPGSRMFMR